MIFESNNETGSTKITTTTIEHEHSMDESIISNEILIGWTLIFGFLAMMFVDHTHCFTSNSNFHGHSHGYENNNQEVNRNASPTNNAPPNYEAIPLKNNLVEDVETLDKETCHDGHKAHSHLEVVNNRRTTVSLGLIIHNCIDGIAVSN